MVRAGVSSMKNGTEARRWLAWTNLSKSSFDTLPWRISCEGTPDSSARMRVASCSADISSEKKPTTAPSSVPPSSLGREVRAAWKADIGGERGLAHGRPPSQHHQVRRVQAAQQAVEIGEAGR